MGSTAGLFFVDVKRNHKLEPARSGSHFSLLTFGDGPLGLNFPRTSLQSTFVSDNRSSIEAKRRKMNKTDEPVNQKCISRLDYKVVPCHGDVFAWILSVIIKLAATIACSSKFKVARRVRCSWKFVGCIIFWPCLFCGWVVSIFFIVAV